MARQIDLPGYRFVAEGVYETLDRVTIAGSVESVRRVVVLSRYTLPQMEDVLDGIKSTAERLSPVYREFRTGKPFVMRHLLEGHLLQLPEEVFDRVLFGLEDDFLRSQISPDLSAKLPESYVEIRFGYLPSADHLYVPDVQFEYALSAPQLLQNGYGQRWKAEMLIKNNTLIPLQELQILLRHGTTTSDTLMINGSCTKPQVYDVFGLLYQQFILYHNVSELRNISDTVALAFGLAPTQALLRRVRECNDPEEAGGLFVSLARFSGGSEEGGTGYLH